MTIGPSTDPCGKGYQHSNIESAMSPPFFAQGADIRYRLISYIFIFLSVCP